MLVKEKLNLALLCILGGKISRNDSKKISNNHNNPYRPIPTNGIWGNCLSKSGQV
ncbi:MAG: hypothetical protein ACTMUB_09010 [cyanobacterium endosymbiont of Rhopalodia musculus]|nr:hypothetical protein [cyanobacterium endosymbiont of Epithemia clementina EcSB]WGT68195.1 hypothetical protein P3F56_03790 [cyanobacterium endosymbiont of Epithemia clementina EcSB]